jgi:DNA polymerase
VTDGRALARAYLEQQRLLGTDAVILPPSETPTPVPPRSDEGVPGRAPVEHGPELPPGLSYDPPPRDLFTTDPLHQVTTLHGVAELVAPCTRCRLCEARIHTVPGEGPDTARLVCVGEGPGRTEDETGRPFVGQAGELLTKILAAIGLARDQVYICNVVKCRPPQNRTPLYDEIAACVPYLFRQIEILAPRVILAMGNTAAQTLLGTKQSLGALRGKVHRFRGIPLIVTYHPAALLRNPNWKKPTWDDVRIAHRLLDD